MTARTEASQPLPAARTSDAAGAAGGRAPADGRSLGRVVAAVLMPLGPAAVAVIRFIIPGEPVGESVAADPGAQRLVLWLGIIALFTLIPGAYAALRLLRRDCPRLIIFSAALLIPGYLAMTSLFAGDVFAMAGTDLGLEPALVDRINDAIISIPTTSILLGVFVIGHITGSVLLGVAMLAARTTPIAAGIAMIISQPLHLLAVIVGSRPLDLVGWGLTAAAMAFLAVRLLRTPNDEWDLPPRRIAFARMQ